MAPAQRRHPLLRWNTWLWLGIGVLAGGKFILKVIFEPTLSNAEKIIAVVAASTVGGFVAACLLWRDHHNNQRAAGETVGPPKNQFLGMDASLLPIWIAVAVVITILFVVFLD